MVRITFILFLLFHFLGANAQIEDTTFCPGAILPDGGLYFPRIKTLPSKKIELDLPFSERIQFFFVSCVGKDGKISNLKFFRAKKYGKDNRYVEILDSLQIATMVDLDCFIKYLKQSTFYPAGDWEGKYIFTCETIFVFEASKAKKNNQKGDRWFRKFELLNW